MDSRSCALALNTLLLTVASVSLSVPLGAILAWLLVRTDLPARRFGLMVLGLMIFVPLYVHAAAWQAAFGVQGWCTLAFAMPPLLDGWTGAIWVHVVAAVPWVVLITAAGFWLAEPELEEQALLDGSPWQVFRRVTLPAALPAVAVATLWTAIVVAGEMTVTDLFRVRTYAEEIYTQLAIGQEPGETPLRILPGILLTALLIAAAAAVCAGLMRQDRPPTWQRRWTFSLAALRGPATLLVVVVLLLLVGLPIASLCYKAGVVVTQTEAGPLRSWSVGKCVLMVAGAPWRYRREFGWSLAICPLAAAASVIVAIPLAWFARGGGWRSLAPLSLTAMCLALPGPMVGLLVIGLLNRPGCPWLWFLYDRSILAPWLALLVRGVPAATLIVWQALRSVPGALLESAAVDGAGPMKRLWRIGLASRRRAVATAFLVALAVALGDLAASILVAPPGVTTLSIQVFGLLHYGVEDQVAGICLALVAIFAALAWAVRGGMRDEGGPRLPSPAVRERGRG